MGDIIKDKNGKEVKKHDFLVDETCLSNRAKVVKVVKGVAYLEQLFNGKRFHVSETELKSSNWVFYEN